MSLPDTIDRPVARTVIGGAPEGVDAREIAAMARAAGGAVLHVARDDARLARLRDLLAFFDPGLRVLSFPAWDTLPYDRVSPNGELVSRRMATLSALAERPSGPLVVLTTVSAALQRVPPRDSVEGAVFAACAGAPLDIEALAAFCERNGYVRTATVREPGEFAQRGGIVDLFPPDAEEPVRLDLFGDEVESIRRFDPVSQRSTGPADALELRPASELHLDPPSVERFRTGYRELFGAVATGDPLYEAVSAGRRFPGMEQWLPLFYDRLETVFDYVSGVAVTLDHQTDQAAEARLDAIAEYYAARQSMAHGGAADGEMAYRPVPPERLFLDAEAWSARLEEGEAAEFSPFAPGPGAGRDLGGRGGPSFAEARARQSAALFDAVHEALDAELGAGRRVAVAAYSAGSAERLSHIFGEHGIAAPVRVDSFEELEALGAREVALAVLPLESGFRTPGLCVVTEQDILGERLIRTARRRRKADTFLTELSGLDEGDLVVHVDHGIGRYDGLETLQVAGAPHDCLQVVYDGGDKLYVPVENMEVLSRYGSEDSGAQLDRLGGAGWQARKARVKARIKDIADRLIRIAAEREIRKGEAMRAPDGTYDEFAARFSYPETDDQERAIADVMDDLASGKPMDRLVCGDVGFGKTEVALRAAFVAVMEGRQVAVVVPTTLLARQHFRTLQERFKDLPVRVAQLSRMVSQKEAGEIRKGLEDGTVDIVVGTHALLAKSVSFDRLGLLIVDEEQHFGVGQKERLKELRADVHVLTLTATPIPRTLQLALSGVREMSLIATPPVDRLAVRTFVLPYDPVVIREAIMREIYRGGQVFYVCPRIEDMPKVAERLRALVPEVKVAQAHGRLGSAELEEVMTAFTEGQFDLLLCTNIVESGLDMPRVNTIVIHRADMFGLAQLYQLRGRVGRSKVRAYAYLTIPTDRALKGAAQKRLEVMQTLDTLGAGFSLASHDMDIRGAGNLLGEEQSGHVREVGIELYQHMLEEAVAAARDAGDREPLEAEEWTPQITIGTPVLIPESYVSDLQIRLGLYRRTASLVDQAEIDSFGAELADRFGPLPNEVKNLLDIVVIKQLCRAAGVDKLDAGPKGAVLSFRNDQFANPAGLVDFIAEQAGTVKLRPDHKLVYRRNWDRPEDRVRGVSQLMKRIASLAQAEAA